MTNLKIWACTVFGIVGSFISQLFGGWTEDMITLIIFMAIDFIMGLVVAGVFQKSGKSESGALNSRAGWKGLCKKSITLLFILIAYRLDLLLDTTYIKSTVVFGFIANEGLSIVENAGLMGITLPKAITKAIDVLKNKGDDDE